MNDRKRLEKIASFGDVVCSIPSGIAVANPQDNEDGYYLEVSSVAEAYNEMEQAELLKSEEEWKAE